ncbi:MAG: hypothetical protein IPH91_02145 [Elusimicrobia bacterium]|nr:hypothetical protein [Elusimicrobiota bacterium]
MKSYWPLSALIDYISAVPFGPCASGARVRIISGGYGHYDDEYVYKFKRISPSPQVTFEERHSGAFQPEKYFLDFLSPVTSLPTIDPWPFAENSESAVFVQSEILFKKAPLLIAKHSPQGWEFLSDEQSTDLIQMRFGDIASLDKTLSRLSNIKSGSIVRRPSLSAGWVESIDEPR